MESCQHSRPNQARIVYEHLCKYGEITSWEAIQKYGITRLSARIAELRDAGHPIVTKLKTVKTRNERMTNIAVYSFAYERKQDEQI